jgi:hypothetical protein
MKEHKYIEFESDELKKDEIPPFDNYSDVEYLVDRETLMIRRTLMFKLKRRMYKNKGRTYSLLIMGVILMLLVINL